MSKRILIVGGTGMLGHPVSFEFIKNGFEVSILSTHPEKAKNMFGDKVKVFEGDVTDPESLKPALENQEAVYINLNSELDKTKYEQIEIGGTGNVAQAAKEAGVKRIGNISGASSSGEETGVIFRDAKVQAERKLIESGVPFTIFRPSWFYESLPKFIQMGRAVILGDQPKKFGWLSAHDYAKQVVKAYQIEAAANKCFYNLGPAKLTMEEALAVFCEYHYPDLEVEHVRFFQAKMIAQMPGLEKLKLAIPFFEYFETNNETADPTEANELLGANLTTVEMWAKEYQKTE